MSITRLVLKGGTERSEIVCKRGAFSMIEALGGGLLFTDSNVYSLYQREIDGCGLPVHVMPAGEEHKNAETLLTLLKAMAEAELRRNSKLVALGGGVVGDIGGLAASLYMRGIACIQVPTTLLAQVDSSVGGKTAIDFCGVKNLVGTFKQPERVIADPAFLATLPMRELRCGLGEIVKHGALCPTLFSLLEQNRRRLTDLAFLEEIIPANIAFKASVVKQDPKETGLRKCLNLGHTTAHVIELSEGTLSHGACVLFGLLIEGAIAERRCACDKDFLLALASLCREALGETSLPKHLNVRLALHDKKNTDEHVVLTAPIAAGQFSLLRLTIGEYERELSRCAEELC